MYSKVTLLSLRVWRCNPFVTGEMEKMEREELN